MSARVDLSLPVRFRSSRRRRRTSKLGRLVAHPSDERDGSSGADGGEEACDFGAEMLGLPRQLRGRRQDLTGRGPRLLRGLRHARDVARHLAGAGRGCATLRTISWVAAPCCSTAAAIDVATPSISRIRPVIPPIAVTACAVTP